MFGPASHRSQLFNRFLAFWSCLKRYLKLEKLNLEDFCTFERVKNFRINQSIFFLQSMEVECPVGNVVGSVEQVEWWPFYIFCLLFLVFLSFDQMAPFLQSMSLFTPTYTVHDGAGNEKFIVQVILSSKSVISFNFVLFSFLLFASSPQGPSSMSCFKSCCECCRTRDVIFRCCFIAPFHLKLFVTSSKLPHLKG